MSETGVIPWKRLERLSVTMFLLGAGLLIINSGILVYDVIEGTELRLPLGQVFIGAGWAAVLVGMLGMYPRLADRRPWLARASALFAGIGIFGYTLMAVTHVAAVAGIPDSTLEPFVPVFFLPVLVGTFVAFPLFAATSLLTGAYSRPISILLVAPPVTFVVNVLTGPSAESILGVVVALVVVFATIGYLLRTDGGSVDRPPSPTDTSV